MEVLDPRNTLITNQEVLELLNQAKIQQKYTRGSQNHNTIVYEASKYLNDTNAASQNRKSIIELVNLLKKFKLTGSEVFKLEVFKYNFANLIGIFPMRLIYII